LIINIIKANSKGQVWWHTPIITATQEAEVGGLQSKASPGKSKRSYLENKLKAKGLGSMVPAVEHFLASTMPRVKSPAPQKY
jgi:hypothetical protein